MATDLTEYFQQGREARVCDGASMKDCPYYASSLAADAWLAGYMFEGPRPTDFILGSVTAGRGGRVNVYANPRMKGRFPKLVYRIHWRRDGATVEREG